MRKHARDNHILVLVFGVVILAGCSAETATEPPADPAISGSITGSVTASNAGVAGVTVSLEGPVRSSAVTGSGGGYSFVGLPAGGYAVAISGYPSDVSFPTTSKAISISAASQTAVVDFSGSKATTPPAGSNRVTVGQTPGSSGMGVVTGPSGINCSISSHGASGVCSAVFKTGDRVTLTATPASGSSMAQWGGSCAGAGSANSCTLGMNGNFNYDPTASFSGTSPSQPPAASGPNRLTVGQTPGSTGYGTIAGPGGINCSISPDGAIGNCSVLVTLGSTATLVATPAAGSTFGGWGGSCLGAGSSSSCTLGVSLAGYNYDAKALFRR